MDINNARLRQFLNDYFDGDELHDLCFDYFPRVQQEFTSGMTKSDQVRLLLMHCRNHDERDRLIGALQKLRPGPFQQEFELAQPELVPTRAAVTPISRNPRQVFISHASEDAKLAHRLATDLQQRGWQVWIAPDSIQPGEKWVAAINRGLLESGVFLLLVSEHAVQSHWVNSEADIAIQWEHERTVRFIPVQTSSHPIAHIPPMWHRHQDISFVGRYVDGLNPLLAQLEVRTYMPPPSAPPVWQSVGEWLKRVPYGIWLSIVALIILVIFINRFDSIFGSGTSEPTAVAVIALTNTPAIVTATPPPTAKLEATVQSSDTSQPPTATDMPTPSDDFQLGDAMQRSKDGMTMVFVPGGTFMMGSSEAEIDDAIELCKQRDTYCPRALFADEAPAHEVQVDRFWLDQHEVTNAQFALFLNAEGNKEEGGVTWLGSDSSAVLIEETGGIFQPKEGYDNHPVIEVNWYGASAYCEWVGGELPTEAQWEYAVRGPDGSTYSWGNEQPDITLLNYNGNVGSTTSIGSFSPRGDSWVDGQDMAGNIWEWVADWEAYYSASPTINPKGPTNGIDKVVRGGSWNAPPDYVHGAFRDTRILVFRGDNVGFRCAVSPGS